MNNVNRFLLMLIAMAAIMLLAVGIDRGMTFYEQKKWESERSVFYEEAKADIAQMQATIQTLSEDQEALLSYIGEYELNVEEMDYYEADLPVSENTGENSDVDLISGEDSLSENSISEETISDNSVVEPGVSDNSSLEFSVSDNSVSENSISESSVSGNEMWETGVSGNSVSGNSISGDSVSGNSVSGNRASYEKTIQINQSDRKIISESTIDFSGKKIACLGDSITAAANLEGQEDYLKKSYPYQLGKILNAGEVVNLGIGGSSIGRYWDNAFVDRYDEIPGDTDIIIVMGGTNDGFCASEKELGSLDKREKRTFAGDLNELLSGLQDHYPKAEIVLVTPLPNVLHDMLRKSRDFLLPQSAFVSIMLQLGAEYEIPVIDLYHSGILDSHDAAVIHSLIPDGVHGNEMGYRYLAEHIAAKLIQIEEKKAEEE